MSESEIFKAAVKLQPQQRTAFLDQSCGADGDLRREVESLLRAHDAVDNFTLNQPTFPPQDASPTAFAEQPGTMIGPYKLLQLLGEGGMGTVWMSEQTQPVRRRVALKIIKSGMDSAQVLRRFEAERQALALMDHTNIAKVLDAGTTGETRNAERGTRNEDVELPSVPSSEFRVPTSAGRPYFVMELISGVPITKYCDELSLPIRERLGLFLPVCQAIQHAHQKGIIHRDIKPSNVLVCIQDGKPVPKVIDFGVAKALHQQLGEHSLYTEFGAVIGTLEYMSPEQAEMSPLGVDTRTDVYALGVLLYELLTGSTPLDRKRLSGAAFAALIMLIKEQEPPKPSTKLTQSKESLASLAAHRRSDPAKLVKEVRAELDWIAMKCLEKDRGRRYESASALAHDVERYLRDEPVEACPPSVAYRLRKLVRRHRTIAMAASMTLVIIGIALANHLVGWVRLKEARGRAIAEWHRARDAEADAKEERDRALKAADEERLAKKAALDAQQAEAIERKRAEEERDAKDKALVRAEGLRLTAQSSAEMHTDPGLGLLLAIEAAKFSPSKEANEALFTALETCREERTLLGHTNDVLSARFTPDGKRIMSCAKDGTIRFWDSESGKQQFATLAIGGVYGGPAMAGAVLSPDGKLFVTFQNGIANIYTKDNREFQYTDRVVRVWDATTGKQLAVLRGHQGRVTSAAFSTDSKRLVTGSADATARVWELPNGKQLAVLEGHASALYSARFSPDGQRVLTISSTAQASKSSEVPGRKTRPEDVDPEEIRVPAPNESLGGGYSGGGGSWSAYNGDEKILARVWDAQSGKPVATILKPRVFGEHEVPSFGHFSPDGERVALGFADSGRVEIWDVASSKSVLWVPHNGMSGEDHVTWSPNGKRLATMHGNYFTIWNGTDGREVITFRGHESTLRTFSFSADGKLMLTTSWDRTARVWNADTGEQVAIFRGHKSRVHTANLSPDGQRVVTASEDGTVRVWWLNPPRDQALPVAEPVINFRTMALSPDGRIMATGAEDYFHEPRIWDTATGKLLHGLKAPPPEGVRAKLPIRGSVATVQGVIFSPDGRRLLTIANEELIKIRKDSSKGMPTIPFFSKPKPPPADDDAESKNDEPLPYTPARIWDVATGKQVAALQAGEFCPSCACFSPDGRKVLVTDGNEQRYAVYLDKGRSISSGAISGNSGKPTFARVYNADTGKELLKLPHQGSILRGEFSSDGRKILTSGNSSRFPNKDIKVWDAETGKELFALDKSSSERIACFDPHGKKLVHFDNPIRIHDAETGKELIRFPGFDVWGSNWKLRSAGYSPFSPDGKKLLAFGPEGLGLIDIETGKQLVSFKGHTAHLYSAQFSTDGKFVVTASEDQTARVWDAATGKELHILRHRGGVSFAVVTSDSRRVVTASDTVRVWELDPLPIAIRRKPRELATYEKERFGIK